MGKLTRRPPGKVLECFRAQRSQASCFHGSSESDDEPKPILIIQTPLKKYFVPVLLILIAAKVAGVLARGPSPIESDALGYWNLSTLVMQGDWLMRGEPIAYRTPIYPWFLAIVRGISPRPLATLVAIQGMLYVAMIWITCVLARLISGRDAAIPVTLLLSLPMISAITFSATVLTESLFIFLMMLHFLAVYQYAANPTKLRASWAAASFALLVLTRPIALYLWVAHGILLFVTWWQGRKDDRRTGDVTPDGESKEKQTLQFCWSHLIFVVVIVLAAFTPWWMRNSQIFGKTMLTEFVGRNIWIVTFQPGSGAGLSLPDSSEAKDLKRRLISVEPWNQWEDSSIDDTARWRLTWPVSNALVDSGLDDAQADRLMYRVASQAARAESVAFSKKAIRRTINFWRTAATDLPPQGTSSGDFRNEVTWEAGIPLIDGILDRRFSVSVAGNTFLMFLTAIAVIHLMCRRQFRAAGLWIGATLAYFCVVTGILEIPAYRYRIVVEPLVLLMCSTSLALWIRPPETCED